MWIKLSQVICFKRSASCTFHQEDCIILIWDSIATRVELDCFHFVGHRNVRCTWFIHCYGLSLWTLFKTYYFLVLLHITSNCLFTSDVELIIWLYTVPERLSLGLQVRPPLHTRTHTHHMAHGHTHHTAHAHTRPCVCTIHTCMHIRTHTHWGESPVIILPGKPPVLVTSSIVLHNISIYVFSECSECHLFRILSPGQKDRQTLLFPYTHRPMQCHMQWHAAIGM